MNAHPLGRAVEGQLRKLGHTDEQVQHLGVLAKAHTGECSSKHGGVSAALLR
jgi:hypothetical protein